MYADIVEFSQDTKKNVAELIIADEETELHYSTSQWGTFVKGINEFFPTEAGVTFNYWFSLYVDGVFSNVGIDLVEVVPGMGISFVETTSLDEIDVTVDRLINEFIENHAATFLNNTTVDHYVLAAMSQLITHGYDVPSLDTFITNATTRNFDRATIGGSLKTAIFEAAFSLNIVMTRTALEGFSTTSGWGAIPLLQGLTITQGDLLQVESLIAMLTTLNSEDGNGPDYFGMLLTALAPHSNIDGLGEAEQASYLAMITELQREIKLTLTADGVESWGSANASSTAMVIIGLVGHGIDPRGEDFTVDGYDLIEALLKYEANYGAFRWKLTDADADMLFSTPQAFSALVAYKLYRDTWGTPPFDLFDFNGA